MGAGTWWQSVPAPGGRGSRPVPPGLVAPVNSVSVRLLPLQSGPLLTCRFTKRFTVLRLEFPSPKGSVSLRREIIKNKLPAADLGLLCVWVGHAAS